MKILLAAAFVLILFSSPAVADIPITGRILDSEGSPVANAEVTLTSIVSPIARAQLDLNSAKAQEPTARTLSDPSGAFRLISKSAGLWLIRIDAAGFVPLETVLTPLLEEVDKGEIVLARDAGVKIRVTSPEQKPLAGVLVRVEDQEHRDYTMTQPWRNSPRSAITDEAGVASIARAKNEILMIAASALGFVLEERKNVREKSVALQLRSGTAVALRAEDGHGRAMNGAWLFLGESEYPVAMSNETGALAVTVSPGSPAPAKLLAPDGRTFRWTFSVPADTQKIVKIRLPDSPVIYGRIVDEDTGAPVEGGFLWSPAERWNSVVAAKSGAYRLTQPSGATNLKAAAEGYLEKWLSDFSLPSGGETNYTLALARSGILEGKVVDSAGQPLPNVDLQVDSGFLIGGTARYFSHASRKLRGRPDGSFRISGLDHRRVARVTASSPGLAPVTMEFNLIQSSRIRRGIVMKLGSGQSAQGLVTDAENRPVPNASVLLQPSSVEQDGSVMSDSVPHATVRAATDAAGAFRLEGIPSGKIDLEVSAAGFSKHVLSGIDIPESAKPVILERIVLHPGAAFAGQVLTPDKTPVSGAQIRMEPSDTEGWRLQNKDPDALTGPDGRFLISDQEEGKKVDLRVTSEGFVELQLEAVTISGSEPFLLTLKPGSTISGKALDESGSAITSATVMLLYNSASENGMIRTFVEDTVTADSEGSFSFKGVEASIYSLAVKATGWQDFVEEGITVVESKDIKGLKLVLKPEVILEGTITTPDGLPAIGAQVQRIVDQHSYYRPYISRAFSDGTGAFQMHGLKAGKVSVQVTHELYPKLTKDLELQEGINRADFQMSGGNVVSGRVVDEGGAPISDASVVLFFGQRRMTVTQADGTFVLKSIPDGSHMLGVQKQGMIPVNPRDMVEVAGASVEGVVVTMSHGITITGNVLGLTAAEIGQVSIEGSTEQGMEYPVTRSDYKGAYRLQGLRPGLWWITGRIPGGKQVNEQIRLEAGVREATLDLRFGQGIKLKGTVVRSEEPLSGATVIASGRDEDSYGDASTGLDGRFEMEGLKQGVHTIRVGDQHELNYSQEVDLQSDQEILITIPETQIRGRVLDAFDNTPIAGSMLSLAAANTAEIKQAAASSSGSDGNFLLRNVKNGNWVLSARKEGYAAASLPVLVQGDQDVEGVDFLLQRSDALYLAVTLPGGGVPDRVTIAVLDASGRSVVGGSYSTREGGRVRLDSIPQGAWEILLVASNSAVTRILTSVPQPTPVAVRLLAATSLHIQIPDLLQSNQIAKAVLTGSDGKPFRYVSGWSGAVLPEMDVSSGDLFINALPPDTWSVDATLNDGRKWTGTVTTAPGAPAQLVLR